MRWSLFLEEFSFKISYREGKLNVKPDLLSRRVDFKSVVPEPPKVLLPREMFNDLDLCATGTQILIPSNDPPVFSDVLRTEIKLAKDWPLAIAHFYESHEWLDMPAQYLKKCKAEITNFTTRASQLFRKLNDGISTAKYVPNVGREAIMKRFHEGLGHLKFDSLEGLLSERYWWPNWRSDFKSFLGRCHSALVPLRHRSGRYLQLASRSSDGGSILFKICRRR